MNSNNNVIPASTQLPGECQSGTCSTCGAPEYMPSSWLGILPPQPRKTCACLPWQWPTTSSTGTIGYGTFSTAVEQERDLYKRALLQIRKCKDSPDTIQAVLDVALAGE